jgi:ABC-type branched-subunit amino acid transport system substrate-binding protein
VKRLNLASQAFAALVMAAGIAYGVGARAENGVSATEVVIGQSASLTGTAGEVGQQLRDGALAYFELVNRKGGINGRKIRLISLDDGGHTSEAALPIVAKADIPFFGAATGGETVHGQFNKNVINVRSSYRRETEAMVDYLVSIGQKKIGMIYHKDDLTKSNLKMTEDALMKHGLKIAGSGAVDRNSTDVKEAFGILSQVAPEAVICNAAVKPFGEFVRQMKKAGVPAQFLSVSFVGSPIVKELGADSAGVIMSQVVPLPTKRSIPIVNEYQTALAATGSKAVHSFNGLEGFITAKVFVEALKRTGKDVTRPKFVKAVEGITELDLGGYFVGYSPTKHNGSSYVDITVINREGRFFN